MLFRSGMNRSASESRNGSTAITSDPIDATSAIATPTISRRGDLGVGVGAGAGADAAIGSECGAKSSFMTGIVRRGCVPRIERGPARVGMHPHTGGGGHKWDRYPDTVRIFRSMAVAVLILSIPATVVRAEDLKRWRFVLPSGEFLTENGTIQVIEGLPSV